MVPSIAISNLSIVEGDSGTTPFTASISLTNYYGGVLPVTVKVTASPGAASEKDYVFTTTEVTLGTDAGVQSVSGFIVGDIEPEGDEGFMLTATPVASDGGFAPYLYSSGGMITIKDDDQARASRLHVEGATLLEGDLGTKQVEIRVSLEPASTSDVKVKYQSQDGMAVAKSDYLPVSGTLDFAPGEVLKTITVDILGDTVPEPDETFSVVLSDPSMALLGTPRADVVIANDDVASPPLDALPPIDAIDSQPDGGVRDNVDASDDSSMVDARVVPNNGFDSKPDSDSRLPTGNDTGPRFVSDGAVAPSNDSGSGDSVASSARDSGAPGSSPSLNSGCSCSTGGEGGSPGMMFLVGAMLAAWRRRRRR